jgi:hypothetical protein
MPRAKAPDITNQIKRLIIDAYGETEGREMLRDLLKAMHATAPGKTKWTVEELISLAEIYARGEDN